MNEKSKIRDVLELLKSRKSRTDEDILKEKRAERNCGKANAVEVTAQSYPQPIMVESFPNGYGLALPETMLITQKAGFPVACYSAWKSEDGSTNRLINRFYLGNKSFRGTCLLFGWKNNAPAPLTTEQANIVCDILSERKILLDRGQ